MNISLLGLDIAKNIFQLHGVDSAGKKRPFNREVQQRL